MKSIFFMLCIILLCYTASSQVHTDSQNNVGIGTTTPQEKLHVNSTGTNNTALFESTDPYALIHLKDNTSSDSELVRRLGDQTTLFSGGISHLTLNGSGNVGIGTGNPQAKLHVASSNRTRMRIGGPGSSAGAIADLEFRPSDGSLVGNSLHWTFSYRTDSWSSQPGDLVLYSHNGTNYTSPIIFQTDGDVAMVTGNGAVRDGRVGIGTISPSSKLHVSDNKRTTIRLGGPSNSTAAVGDLTIRPSDDNPVGGAYYWTWSFRTDSWSSAPGDLVLYNNNGTSYTSPIIVQTDGDIALATGNNSARNGKVAIGTTDFSTDHKLVVNGSIGTRKIVVDPTAGWADFVFADDYQLPALNEVENFIKANKHLPEIPTEKEVEANGIDLGTMNAKLLQKVEELTLYLIEEHKSNQKLQKEVDKLKREMKALKQE